MAKKGFNPNYFNKQIEKIDKRISEIESALKTEKNQTKIRVLDHERHELYRDKIKKSAQFRVRKKKSDLKIKAMKASGGNKSEIIRQMSNLAIPKPIE